MSWSDVAFETDRFLDLDYSITPGTGCFRDRTEPLPKLEAGVSMYNMTKAWINETWGGYDKMPIEGRCAWDRLLAVSRGQPGNKVDILNRWAQWLLSDVARQLHIPRTAAGPFLDENAFVPMSEIWPEQFKTAAVCSKFLDKHDTEIRQRKPAPNRRLVYLPDWHRYWQQREKIRSDALGDEKLQKELDDIEARKANERPK